MTDDFSLDDPYPYYARLRETTPIWRTPQGRWMISRHADALALLRDSRCLHWGEAAGRLAPSASSLAAVLAEFAPETGGFRTAITDALRAHADRHQLNALASSIIGSLRGRERFDMVKDFAHPFTFGVISGILGVPEPLISELSDLPECLDGSYLQNGGELKQALKGLLIEKRRNPSPDLLTRIAAAPAHDDEFLSQLLLVLFYAGHLNMMNLLGLAALTLARHPAQFDSLRRSPAMAPDALLELMRYDSPLQFIPLLATHPISLRGEFLSPEDEILVAVGATNRDPDVFPDPDSLHWERRPTDQLSFGAGPFRCLGAQLALLEGVAALACFACAVTEFRAASESLSWRTTPMVQRGLNSLTLEVRWNG